MNSIAHALIMLTLYLFLTLFGGITLYFMIAP